MARVDFNLCATVVHLQFPFAIWSLLRGKQRWNQVVDVASTVCSVQKRHLNVPLQLDSDEFVSRANPVKNFCHFSKEQNPTKMVCWMSVKTKWNKIAEMAEWWKYWINLPFYLPYVAAAVSLCTTEKEMIRWASKTKRCKRTLQTNSRFGGERKSGRVWLSSLVISGYLFLSYLIVKGL